jgi:DNA-binding NarL/FixJ family response regulator
MDVGRERILIADEDESDRRHLAAVLENAGFDVEEAPSGTEALRLLGENRYALAILEVPLGEISGYEVCRTLRVDRDVELPVIFISGVRKESYDRVAGFIAGADDYLVKPYVAEELLARVRRLIGRNRERAARVAFGLTKRELEVLRLLADGLGTSAIGERLFITRKTVGTHLEHIFRKLGVQGAAQAVAVAYRDELIEQPRTSS